MGLDSIRSFFNLDDDEDYMDDPYDEFEDVAETPVRKKPVAKPRVQEEYDDEPRQSRGFLGSKPKVVSMNRSTDLAVNIVKPREFEDSQEICNLLLSNRPVIVNLEGFDPDDAQRIMDFILGCIYAINGKYRQISKYIFIFSPDNVDISGDSIPLDDSSSMPLINREF